MTTGRTKSGLYTIIDDDLNFIVVDQSRAAAAKILREQFTSVRVDNILDNVASDSDWRRVFLEAAKRRREQHDPVHSQ